MFFRNLKKKGKLWIQSINHSQFQIGKSTNLSFGLTAHVQLLQTKREMSSKLTSKEPWQAMASWLKYLLKLAESLFYSYRGLINLYATEQISHLFFSVVRAITVNTLYNSFFFFTQKLLKSDYEILITKGNVIKRSLQNSNQLQIKRETQRLNDYKANRSAREGDIRKQKLEVSRKLAKKSRNKVVKNYPK